MYVTTHVAAGALIGVVLPQHYPAIMALSFASHFLLDVIPHGDRHHVVDYWLGERKNLKEAYRHVISDSAFGIITTAVLLGFVATDRASMAVGIIGSVLPDMFVGLSEVWNNSWLKKFTKFHFKIHNKFIHRWIVAPRPGMVMQFAVTAAMLLALRPYV